MNMRLEKHNEPIGTHLKHTIRDCFRLLSGRYVKVGDLVMPKERLADARLIFCQNHRGKFIPGENSLYITVNEKHVMSNTFSNWERQFVLNRVTTRLLDIAANSYKPH
jgi:hypothetical protein